MKLAYIILAHQHPQLIIRLVKHLISNGSVVALHYDLNSGSKDFALIQQELAEYSALVLYAERIKVAWGEWSIVQATLNALDKLAALDAPPDYVHLMSGMDYPIRPEEELRAFLARNYGKEFIQAVDINHKKWITDGLSKERFQYRHYFNWQHHPQIFDWNYALQRKFLPKRKFPKGLTPHMGSQWWILTWSTCITLLERSKDVQLIKFFRTVWIPDEMYIQTLVAATVGKSQIVGKCLTLYQFNHNGVPLVFTNGHHDYLMRQPFFFARKISPYANQLRDILDSCYTGQTKPLSLPDENFGITTKEYEFFLKKNEINNQKGRRIIGLVRDSWYGDLEWNDKPYYIIAGGSLAELQLVQEFLNQQPGIICHGNLFSPQQINFSSSADFYAGFNSADTALRDHSRQNFLTQVIRHDLDKIVAFLLPFDEAEALFDVCLWDKNSRIIVLKTNPFLIYRDHESEINSAAFLTAEEQFLAFWEIYRKFREKHEEFWQKLHSVWKVNREICLYEDGLNWTKQLLEFIEINEIEDQKELKPVGDKKNLLGRYLPPKKFLCKISPYAKLLKNEFDHCYLEKRTPLLTKKIIDIIQYGWYGDLEWNDKPYYIIAGGALSELKIVQEFLNQQTGIICHGNLFSPQRIHFISGADFYAGFNSADTALRDHSRQNFLTQVIRHDLDKIVVFLLPFDEAEALFDICLWDKNSRIIVLKTNPFLLHRDHESELNSAALLTDEEQFLAFWEIYRKFRENHEEFWHKLHNAWKTNLEICLYDAEHPWANQLLNFMNKMERETAKEKGKSFEEILIKSKLVKRIDPKEYNFWLSKYNYREKTLADNNKPYYVIVGGSKIELKFIQDFLNQQVGIICHGDLFATQQINFVKGLNDYAGFNYQDIALRDYNRQNFLFQLIHNDIDKIVAFLVPFSTSGKILDICLWDKNARIIPLKSNPFLLYREYEQEIDISAIWTVTRENQNIENPTVYFNSLRATAFMDLFRKFYYQQHQNFWNNLHHAHSKNCELCLYDIRKSWISELLDFIYRMEFEKEQEIFDLAKQILVAEIKNKKRFLRYITQDEYDRWIDKYYDLYGDTKQLAKLFFNLSSHDQDIIAEYTFFRGNVIWQNMKFLK